MAGKESVRRAAPVWLPAGVAAGFLVLVWAARGGPVDLFDPSDRASAPRQYPSYADRGDAGVPLPTLEEATKDVEQTLDLSWLGDLISWAVFLSALVAVAFAARAVWRRRWRPPPAAPLVDFDVLPAAKEIAERLTEDAEAQRAAIAHGEPRNGIVRCWLLLQESIAAAGIPPGQAETSTEFTVRVLHTLDLDPRAIQQLSELYREARFSHHPLGEDARAKAAAALDVLHADLAQVPAG
jgi:hypothetical protein